MIASLAYSQNSSVFDMAPSQCPDISRGVRLPPYGFHVYTFLCNYLLRLCPQT